jgi:hypothetical protein
MARVLHLLKSDDPLAHTVIEQERAAGDDVTVVALPGAGDLEVPEGIRVTRVPADLTWEALLERIFEADQVITW